MNRSSLTLSILLIQLLISFLLPAQSEKQYLSTTIDSLIKRSKNFQSVNIDSSLLIAKQAVELSFRLGDPRKEILSRHRLGVSYFEKGKWNAALEEYEHVMSVSLQEGWNLEILRVCLDMGNVHLEIGQHHEINNSQKLANISFENAGKFYQRALENFTAELDSVWLARIYLNFGSLNFRKAKDQRAFNYYRKSSRIFRKLNNQEGFANAVVGISLTCRYLGLLDSSKYYYNKAQEFFLSNNNVRGIVISKINLAESYKDNNQISSAIQLLVEADSLSSQLNDESLQVRIKENLGDLYGKQGQFPIAYKYLKEYTELKDRFLDEAANDKIARLDYRFEIQKRENLINKQKVESLVKDRVIYGLTILTLILILIFWRQRWLQIVNKKNKQLQEEQNQKKLKELEIQSMENLLEVRDTERKRIAEDLHDRLGNTLTATRMLFESSANGEVTVAPQTEKAYKLLDKAIAETRHIAYNMLSGVLTKFGLEAALEDLKATVEEVSDLQFGLSYENLDERLNAELELNIYRIIQELVSNSLKYAQASQLNISLKRVDEDVEILIEDDGDGFDINAVKHGMGLKNIETRVKKFKGNWCCNSIKGKGTRTTINFTLYETTDQNFNSG